WPYPLPRRRGRGARYQSRTGEIAGPVLLQMLPQELVRRLVRHLGVALGVIEISNLDVAARLAVVADKALRLIPREAALGIVIIVRLVGPPLDPDRRR